MRIIQTLSAWPGLVAELPEMLGLGVGQLSHFAGDGRQ
jgi:hypothetical protein